MSRRSRYQGNPAHFIPADEFREVNEWSNSEVLELVAFAGSIEASELVATISASCGSYTPPGWAKLNIDHRHKAVWRAIHRLCDRRELEYYHSKHRDHCRSRVRLRVVNVLDRIVHALESA